MITFDSPRIPRFGSAASRGATVIDQATATSFCVPPRPPAGARPPGAGNSGSGADPEATYDYDADLRASDAEVARQARAAAAQPTPRPTPTPTPFPTPVVTPGPSENSGALLATLLTVGVVGGMFLWLTTGPSMVRANPSNIEDEVRRVLMAENGRLLSTTRFKPGKSGGLVVSGEIVMRGTWLWRALEDVAHEHRMLLDTYPVGDRTTIVFTPENAYRHNPHIPQATPLPGASPLASFRNDELAIESYVFAGSRGYNVTLRDLDSGESVPIAYVNIVSWNQALAKAREIANVSSDATPRKPGT